MSVVLHTAANFTVVRQIANHLDSATYYVRAVIRNAYTDAIIATLDLEDKGSQRFKKDWKVPNDPSGEGFYVSIVTSVYSDSGYTTKSENYGDEESTYLVQDRLLTGRGGGAAGGVDARTLRRVIKEELTDAKPETPKAVELPKMRFDEVLKAIKGLEKTLKPEASEPVDMAPVLEAIREVARLVQEKEVTPATDLTEIANDIDALGKDARERNRLLMNFLDSMEGQLAKGVIGELERIVSGTTFKIAPSTATMDVPTQTQRSETTEPDFDINQLAS